MIEYIGIPFSDRGRESELDCYGLVKRWYQNEMNIELPDFVYDSSMGRGVPEIVVQERERWAKVSEPKHGDVVVINIQGRPRHVGIYLSGGKMLHVMRGVNSCIESLRSPMWKSKIEGYYRHE